MTNPTATFKSALWNHAGRVLEYLLLYITSILIARGLGVQQNGAFVGLYSIAQLLLVLTSFGMEVSLTKHIPQLNDEFRDGYIRHLLRRVLALRCLVVAGVSALMFALMALVAAPSSFTAFAWLLAAYAGTRSIVSLVAAVMTAELETRATSVINVAARGLEVASLGFMVSGGLTITSVLVVLLSVAVLQLAAYIIVARHHLIGTTQRMAILPVVTFGGIYWINSLVEYLLGRQGDVLFLTMLSGDSSQASLYDVAFSVSQWASLSMTLGLAGITLAISAKLTLSGPELLNRFYGFMIRITSLLSIPLYAFILFNAESAILVMYSSGYLGAAGLIQGIAAFRIVGRLFGGPENGEFLLARGDVSALVGFGLVGAGMNVGLDLFLIPRMGAAGAVVASGLGNLAVSALAAMAVYRRSSARMQLWFWLKVSGATCASSLLCRLLIPPDGLPLIMLQAATFGFLTICLLVVVKPLTFADWEWLQRIDQRFSMLLKLFVEKRPMISDAGPA